MHHMALVYHTAAVYHMALVYTLEVNNSNHYAMHTLLTVFQITHT